MHKVCYLDHNWLAYKNNNKFMEKQLGKMRGIVYDLGCGTRPYEKEILAVAERYIGVDWANTLHGQHADIVANLNQPLPIESDVADTVISLQVMEHLCEPQVMLGEAFRILKGGGTIYITVPFQWWIHEVPYDFFRYTRYGLQYMLNKAGFVDVLVEESSGFWTMWSLKLNYQLERTQSPKVPQIIRWILLPLLLPIWVANQTVAPLLDKVWPETRETAGYYVSARKP